VPPLTRTIFRGAIFVGSLRFAIRLLGFLSVTITARLLTPVDFGVIGTAAIVTGFFAVLQQNGIGDALTRLKSISAGDIHTAWTINLIVAFLVSAGVLAIAAPAAAWLEEPKLTPVLLHLGLVPLINAAASPGTMTLLRDLKFRHEFELRLLQKAGVVACVVAGAFVMRDYWGLVYGTMAGAVWGVVLSYALAPHPVRLRLAAAGYFLSFSGWTLLQSLAAYVSRTADEVAVRRIADTLTFGLYHVSRDLTRVFVAESVAPAAAALLPGLARLQDDRPRFTRAAMNAMGVGAIVAVAVGFGIAAVAPEAVVLLLGGQWAGAAPFLSIVAIGSAAGTLVGMHRSIVVALGRVDLSAKVSLLRAATIVAACALAALHFGVTGVAIAYAAAWVIWFFLDAEIVFRLLGRPGAAFRIVFRPVVAGLAMVLALWLLPWPAGLPLVVIVALKVTVGAAVYVGSLGLMWLAMGRPDGPEATLIEQLPRVVSRRLLPAR
jgi:O-antigen/teichoic acid export membrane protein